MKKYAIIAAVLGLIGVAFGAMGAHAIRGKISMHHYHAYRVGIEYLFFHLPALFYLSTREANRLYKLSGTFFTIGILCFTGSNLLMTTEAIHHIHFHFLWPITPLGGICLMIGWGIMIYKLVKK